MNTQKKHLKFLIVNDDILVCIVTSQLIRKFCPNCVISVKSEGKAALRYLFTLLADNQLKDPDVIFLDLKMPGMNGLAFLEAFSKFGNNLKHISIYILTSTIDAEVKSITARYAFVKGIIELPLTMALISKIVQPLLTDD